MTFWDFLDKFISGTGFPWLIAVALIVMIVYLITHPEKVSSWNLVLDTVIAKYLPKRRKTVFDKRINNTINNARKAFESEIPALFSKFFPYKLKITWVGTDDKEDIAPLIDDDQIIIFVKDYTDEKIQIVNILDNYCNIGFADQAKYYMPEIQREATNKLVTKKLVQYTHPHILDYFLREYLDHSAVYYPKYQELAQIDSQGLFVPILLNELDKFGSRVYPSDPSPSTFSLVSKFTSFVYDIANKGPLDKPITKFINYDVRVRIILAVSELSTIEDSIKIIETDIRNNDIDTFYILASGKKTSTATVIVEQITEKYPQVLSEPIKISYRRYGKYLAGSEAVCYEVNRFD